VKEERYRPRDTITYALLRRGEGKKKFRKKKHTRATTSQESRAPLRPDTEKGKKMDAKRNARDTLFRFTRYKGGEEGRDTKISEKGKG